MANWKTLPSDNLDRRERVPVKGGWLVKEWSLGAGRIRFVTDSDHAWDGRDAEPQA
ncbi:MAG: hypothetical protein ACI81R_000573 [Bradymonadia bacterium]|jgi:hypothetical protein